MVNGILQTLKLLFQGKEIISINTLSDIRLIA